MLEAQVQRQFDAMNRRDLEAIMRVWAEDAIWEFPGQTPMSGRFEGKPVIRAWFQRWVDHFRYVHFTVTHVAFANPIALTFANTMFVAWDVDLTTVDGISGSGSGISQVRVHRGHSIHGRDYIFDEAMLERIWGRREDAPTPLSGSSGEEAIAVPV